MKIVPYCLWYSHPKQLDSILFIQANRLRIWKIELINELPKNIPILIFGHYFTFLMTKTFWKMCLIIELWKLTSLGGPKSLNHDPPKMYFSAVATIKIAFYCVISDNPFLCDLECQKSHFCYLLANLAISECSYKFHIDLYLFKRGNDILYQVSAALLILVN